MTFSHQRQAITVFNSDIPDHFSTDFDKACQDRGGSTKRSHISARRRIYGISEMTENLFHIIANLDTELTVPATGKKTQVVYHDDNLRAVLFGFAPGEGLSEHTAAMPGILYFVRGEAKISLGDQHSEATVGTWVHMQPNLPHSILAVTDTVMLLLLLKCAKTAAPIPAPEESNETSD